MAFGGGWWSAPCCIFGFSLWFFSRAVPTCESSSCAVISARCVVVNPLLSTLPPSCAAAFEWGFEVVPPRDRSLQPLDSVGQNVPCQEKVKTTKLLHTAAFVPRSPARNSKRESPPLRLPTSDPRIHRAAHSARRLYRGGGLCVCS